MKHREFPVDPFAATTRGITEADPNRAALRAAGPVVRTNAPAGGPVWIVTDDAPARQVLSDPRIVKDPAFAPPDWRGAGLEPTAAEQPSLTTLDGPAHTRLRQAHAPLLTAKRVHEHAGRIHSTARRLLADAARDTPADLMADFTVRYPLTVLLDLLGIPLGHVDAATAACRRMSGEHPDDQAQAIAELAALADTGLVHGGGLAAELRDRLPPETSRAELRYHLFGLIFAGQLTTDAALGFVIARTLTESPGATDETAFDTLVRETLRSHPPAPFSLWRFTTADVELAGEHLPARSPVLVDIEGVNTDPHHSPGPDLTFGAGHHFCVGAQLAQLELRAVATVLRADYPDARLAVPFADLRHTGPGGILGTRLTSLPVILR